MSSICGVIASSASPPSSSSSSSTGHNKSLNPSILTCNSYPHQLPYRQNSLRWWSLSSTSRPRLPRLCSSNSPRSPGSGENENKTVLDAFFLGKALGEALTERIESAVGEVLSTLGRLQAEQQKQVEEFQEDVLERAKRAKEKAAREALQEQGRLLPLPSTNTVNPHVTNGSISSASPQSSGSGSPAAPSVDNQDNAPSSVDEDNVSSIPIDE